MIVKRWLKGAKFLSSTEGTDNHKTQDIAIVLGYLEIWRQILRESVKTVQNSCLWGTRRNNCFS